MGTTLMRRIILRGALVLLSVAAALLVAEAVVRTFVPQDLGLLAPWYESHPVYRYRHYPNMDAQRTWGTPYRLRTNSNAVRADYDVPYQAPRSTRIVVHGDSMTFGVGVENEDTFVQRTQAFLRRSIGNVDVLNLAVSGHAPDQEYLLFLEEGRKYSPRVCVIAVCLGNDLDELAWPDVAFRLEDGHLEFVPYEPPLSKRLAETTIYRWLAERSHLLVLARYTFIDRQVHADRLAVQASQPPPLALAQAVYRDFVAAIRREGAVPVMLLLPTKRQILQHQGLGPDPNPLPSLLRDTLLEFCRTEDVLCIDALEGLARVNRPLEDLFIPGDGHFSPAGHAEVASLLNPHLEHIVDALPAP